MKKLLVLCFILFLYCIMNLSVQANDYSMVEAERSNVTISIIDKSGGTGGNPDRPIKNPDYDLFPNIPGQDIQTDDDFPRTGTINSMLYLTIGLLCIFMGCLSFLSKKLIY